MGRAPAFRAHASVAVHTDDVPLRTAPTSAGGCSSRCFAA